MAENLRSVAPVNWISSDKPGATPAQGIALCLSGGGYRAMLFHLGAVWRLNELGYLKRLNRVSSVSGGSITAGLLGLRWKSLQLDVAQAPKTEFDALIVQPIRKLASTTIDAESVLKGLLPFSSVNEAVTKTYQTCLFGDATLQDLPDDPRFVINATSVQSGVLWRFSRPFMADWRVGVVPRPTTFLAFAVAVSSAFPPFLSPARLTLDPAAFEPGSGDGLQIAPFTSEAVLTDGGVYDNLGLETAWKKFDTILVSDGSASLAAESKPATDWALHSYRILNIIDNQVGSLRKRDLIRSYELPNTDSLYREGSYWGMRSEIAKYPAFVASNCFFDSQNCPVTRTSALAATPTRLSALDDNLQERIVNWGYAICDAAMHAHIDPNLPRASDFPYPLAKV